MALDLLQVDHVRNLRHIRLHDLGRVNVFSGPNGSGKTSVLESLYLLGMARSFRAAAARSLISHEEAYCTVHGRITRPGNRATVSLGVQRWRDGAMKIQVAGEPVRTVAELADELPLQVICADSFGLLTGPPARRRQFLDWGVFHVEQGFFPQWQRFQRSIKQRNMLLRRAKLSRRELAVWTRDLAQSGTAITAYRQSYFRELTPIFEAMMARLAPTLGEVALRFRPGWDSRLAYSEALEQTVGTDLEQGYTHSGPQRADIRLLAGGHPAAEVLSRGQQKLVVCGLMLAQGELVNRLGKRRSAYLVDDLPAELDRENSRKVCGELARLDVQVFITCVQEEDIRSVWPEEQELALFHVEQGEVSRSTGAA